MEGIGADAADVGAHGREAVSEIDDLRLARGVDDFRFPARQRRRHHEILGGTDRNIGEYDAAADQSLRRLGKDIAVMQLDLGTQLSQALEVQIDRARADGAAARQRDLGLAATRHERSQHQHRRAHLAYEIVGGSGVDDAGGLKSHAARGRRRTSSRFRDRDGRAQLAQQAGHRRDIHEVRHIGEMQRFRRQQRRRHQRQGCILGAADLNLAMEPATAANAYPIHALRLLSGMSGQ